MCLHVKRKTEREMNADEICQDFRPKQGNKVSSTHIRPTHTKGNGLPLVIILFCVLWSDAVALIKQTHVHIIFYQEKYC